MSYLALHTFLAVNKRVHDVSEITLIDWKAKDIVLLQR